MVSSWRGRIGEDGRKVCVSTGEPFPFLESGMELGISSLVFTLSCQQNNVHLAKCLFSSACLQREQQYSLTMVCLLCHVM